MKTRYTPGPWAMVPQVFRGIETYKIKGPAKTGPQLVGRIEYEADARLIAAAPELLAALKGMVVAHELNLWKTINGTDEAVIGKIKAAIAAAEGKEEVCPK